jgi:ADP-ribose pyrophosphatase YjhB (NUDIX family)
VTREHPQTGADELLVFDVPSRPEFTAVVPGGGIEPGEGVAEAAIREAKEETGVDVAFVREVGVAENPGQVDPNFLHEAHYVHSTAPSRLPETWEHRVTGHGAEEGAVVVCRWIPVSETTEVWGLRGAFIGALVRSRVSAYVTRERDGEVELLVFDHRGMPEAGTQVPAGRVDAHETLEEGALREVAEETGLHVEIRTVLADPEEHDLAHGLDAHKTTAFHATAAAHGPDAWAHPVSGTGMDVGLVYECRWVPIDECPPLWGKPDPLVEKLRRSISRG